MRCYCGEPVRYAPTGNPERDVLVHTRTDSVFCSPPPERRASLAPPFMGTVEERLALREMQLACAGDIIERLVSAAKAREPAKPDPFRFEMGYQKLAEYAEREEAVRRVRALVARLE